MPYIKKEDRKVYNVTIARVVESILAETKLVERSELLGEFCRSLVLGYANQIARAHYGLCKVNGHNAMVLLSVLKGKWRTHLHYFEMAGDLNYIMSAAIWGVEGAADPAKYGFRSMVKSILLEIHDQVPEMFRGINEPIVRKRTIRMFRGVISDVIDENYRRNTAKYEDCKMVEAGDIWPLQDE